MALAIGFGVGATYAVMHPGKTKGIFAIGVNASESWTYAWPRYIDAIEGGAKMLCVDPRYTETVRNSELWLPIRPGTDAALMLAMINVIIEEDLYDKEFVEKWCYGFDKLRQRAKEYTPEKAAEVTWIPAEKIREAARFVAKNHPCSFPYGYAIESAGRNSMNNVRLKYILASITGNIDVEGGEYLHARSKHRNVFEAFSVALREIDLSIMSKQIGADKYRAQTSTIAPLLAMEGMNKGYWKGAPNIGMPSPNWPTTIEAILTEKPYPVKAMIAGETGPMRTYPNIKKVYQALQKLELFVYIEDAQMTPEAMLADYLLPTTSQFERPSGYSTISGQAPIEYELAGDRALPKVIPGLWDLRDDYDVLREFAVRVAGEKVERGWPQKNLEEMQKWYYEPVGWTNKQVVEEWHGMAPYEPRFKKYEELDPKTGRPRGFGTPGGKVAIYSTILEQLKYDPLPYYVECAWTPISAPDIAQDYPLIMTTGSRFQEAHHGELRHISLMRHLRPVPQVKMHPLTARTLGISDGEWVYIETPLGRCRQTVKYDSGVNPKVIDPEHGWWRPELPAEEPTLYGWQDWNINVAVPDSPEHLSPELGAWCFKALLAKVYSENKP